MNCQNCGMDLSDLVPNNKDSEIECTVSIVCPGCEASILAKITKEIRATIVSIVEKGKPTNIGKKVITVTDNGSYDDILVEQGEVVANVKNKYYKVKIKGSEGASTYCTELCFFTIKAASAYYTDCANRRISHLQDTIDFIQGQINDFKHNELYKEGLRMGREIRKVPKDWEHPKDCNGKYVSLLAGSDYESHCERHNDDLDDVPDKDCYTPDWPESEKTHFQVYETVSEGTPVTPVFESKEEIVKYLTTRGDFWDQRRCSGPWNIESAEKFVKNEWAVSGIVSNGKVLTPKDQ